MARKKSYMLLCPIARALDRVGDRWTLLILRDLFAGPARFSDLQSGLKGIASNLLTTRLAQLVEDELVVKRSSDLGVELYELTPLGRRSNKLLFELALFGGQFEAEEELKQPSNLKTVVVTLQSAIDRVEIPSTEFSAAFVVDGENFEIVSKDGAALVLYRNAQNLDVRIETSYLPLLNVSEGELSVEEFIEKHMKVTAINPEKVEPVSKLMMDVIAELRSSVAAD